MAQDSAGGRAPGEADGDAVAPASAANGIKPDGARSDRHHQSPLHEAGKISSTFGQVLHQRLVAYTGNVDEFGCPGNTVDSWRHEFSGRSFHLHVMNGTNGSKRPR